MRDASGSTPPVSRLGPPDISQMSPEERATRLYNRVLTLHSEGKADSAGFFLPMALQAYAMLPALDVDARYHIGVLDLTGGDETGALAQADSINHAVPNHLFASMLRARALELRRDAPGARQAYDNFLRHEAAERARKRPEYAEHETNLNTFHEQAIRATDADHAPWYVIPADSKTQRNLAIASVMVETLEHMKLAYPAPHPEYAKLRIT